MTQETTKVLQCSRISGTICKQPTPCFRQITTPTPHQSMFTGQMLFLMCNQQCQSTEGSWILRKTDTKILSSLPGGDRHAGVIQRWHGVSARRRQCLRCRNDDTTGRGCFLHSQAACCHHYYQWNTDQFKATHMDIEEYRTHIHVGPHTG